MARIYASRVISSARAFTLKYACQDETSSGPSCKSLVIFNLHVDLLFVE